MNKEKKKELKNILHKKNHEIAMMIRDNHEYLDSCKGKWELINKFNYLLKKNNIHSDISEDIIKELKKKSFENGLIYIYDFYLNNSSLSMDRAKVNLSCNSK